MTHGPRLHLLTSLLACVLALWLAVAALPAAPMVEPMPAGGAPAAASGSGYPAPQTDPSTPVQEPSPTF